MAQNIQLFGPPAAVNPNLVTQNHNYIGFGHGKTYKTTFALTKDSDLFVHTRSLIRNVAIRMKKPSVIGCLLSKGRLRSNCVACVVLRQFYTWICFCCAKSYIEERSKSKAEVLPLFPFSIRIKPTCHTSRYLFVRSEFVIGLVLSWRHSN